MSYGLRLNGKRLPFGFGRLQPAISAAQAVEEPGTLEVVDEGGDVDRVVWTRKELSDGETKRAE